MQNIGEDVVGDDVRTNKGEKEKGNKINNERDNEFLESMTPIHG